MGDGLVLAPDAGTKLGGSGMTLKVGADRTPLWSVFEAEVAPGFDVGAHLHGEAEELFYILDGELDLLAFEPRERTPPDWRDWESADGLGVTRAGPGSLMYVPAGCPHAFFNPGRTATRMLFHVAPSGHEHYIRELGELLAISGGAPEQNAIVELRRRHDIVQLTPLRTYR